ncbi:hypothetical protein VTN49DRAFT_7119 [Thermomyces lanuginosus]|uniref:uncharacterized protein n=1 Tax=Thermomyces lanuginosus TaxID=5541 RepID=UPI003743F7D8
MLSNRGENYASSWALPWRYAPSHTYNKDTNPNGLISLAVAENAPMREEMTKFINDKVAFSKDAISYGPHPSIARRLRQGLANHFARYFHPREPVNPDHIVIATNATALGNILAHSLADPGDAILVSRPMYGRFEIDFGIQAGVSIVYADTEPEEAFSPEVVQKFEDALVKSETEGRRIRAVLIVNPNNPVGRCYPPETLAAIANFCARHRLHLISDEVYALSTFDSGDPNAVPFTSVLSLQLPIEPNFIHVLYGFAKDFASGGLSLGFLLTSNEQLRIASSALMRFHRPSGLALVVGMAVLEDVDFLASFTAKNRKHLTASYKLVTSALDEKGIPYVKGGSGGFFVYIDLSRFLPPGEDEHLPPLSRTYNTRQATEREFTLARKLLDAGVILHPGEEHAKHVGWFRLVFSQDEDTLREGLARLFKALGV